MKNWETFQAAYQAAPEDKKALIDSDTIPNCVKYQVGFKTIDSSLQGKMIQMCAHYVLGTVQKGEMVKEMQSLGIPSAEEIFTTLTNCIQKPDDKRDQKPASDTPDSTDSSLESEIKEAEAAMSSIPKIKTMAQAVEEATHSSSQADILHKKEK